MNKKLYWGTVSLIAFIALTSISAGYSLVEFTNGSDLGIRSDEFTKSGLASLKTPGYFITYIFGFGGLAILSFSLKRFKTFAISAIAYALLLISGALLALAVFGFTHYLIIIFGTLGALIVWLSFKIKNDILKLGQW